MVSGDFNEILYSFEKSGGQPRKERRMAAFCEVLDDCQLMDLGFQGTWFTWERGNLPETNIKERLDRGWLMRSGCIFSHKEQFIIVPFSFTQAMRKRLGEGHGLSLKHSGHLRKIKKSWESSNGMIFEKLGRLQSCLTSWASLIKRGRDGLKKELTKDLRILLDGERNDDTMAKIIDTRISLNMEIDKDEMYWEQRARANWLKLGDKNSAFFHKYASAQRRINTINRLETEEWQEVTDDLEINNTASRYFQKLFTLK
ncbi:reverse transcriptase [Gossypium australe]|uniref:Reverse transcriptase n=1 Tax=Gossypium australe TaxID=47621 RepID=A0A5B6W8J4_9ROSI|nr:reverse transcriptase [Gossypium australe]